MVDKLPRKVTGQSSYAITICIICNIAAICIIHDPVYNAQVAASYVPPFCPTVGWYDWVNEATLKHAHEVCVKSFLRSLLCWQGCHVNHEI